VYLGAPYAFFIKVLLTYQKKSNMRMLFQVHNIQRFSQNKD
jgi:hypothetical protein